MLAIVQKGTDDQEDDQNDALKFDLQRSIDIGKLAESLTKAKPYIAKIEAMNVEEIQWKGILQIILFKSFLAYI